MFIFTDMQNVPTFSLFKKIELYIDSYGKLHGESNGYIIISQNGLFCKTFLFHDILQCKTILFHFSSKRTFSNVKSVLYIKIHCTMYYFLNYWWKRSISSFLFLHYDDTKRSFSYVFVMSLNIFFPERSFNF